MHMLLGKILALLSSFIRRPHQSLAAIGVAAFVRLMNNAGSLFTEDKWDQVRCEWGRSLLRDRPLLLIRRDQACCRGSERERERKRLDLLQGDRVQSDRVV